MPLGLQAGADAFWKGHLQTVLSSFGSVGQNVNSGVAGRLTGSSDRQLVLYSRMGFAALVVAFAAVGLFRRWRLGVRQKGLVVATMAAIPVVGLQSYGGEVVLRVQRVVEPEGANSSDGATSVAVSESGGFSVLTPERAAMAGFARVRRWTRSLDLFSPGLHFLLVPVSHGLHWSLVVVCHAGVAVPAGGGDRRSASSGGISSCFVRSFGGSCIALGWRRSIGREMSSGARPDCFAASMIA